MFNRIIRLSSYIGSLGYLFRDISLWSLRGRKDMKDYLRQMIILGLDSLPLVAIVAVFTGIIIAFQTAYQLQRLSSEIYIASLVALSIVRELGPVLTALIVAGRSGAAITAQISTMKVTEQLDALRSLSADPVDYLILPRFIALIFMLPLLVIYADLLGIFGGFIVGKTKFGMSMWMYFRMSFESLHFKDIGAGVIKAFCFAVIISLVCAKEGFDSSLGSDGVGAAVNRAVVRSFIFVIITDCFLTALFYMVF